MKVEIAESFILSWLRHAQGCVVTQMNWKPSPTWAVARERELNQAFDAVRSFAGEAIGVHIFKRCEFRQFLRQTEIEDRHARATEPPRSGDPRSVDT